MKRTLAMALLAAALLSGCASTRERVLDIGDSSQLQKRSIQSRTFDTPDKERVLRAAIATMQDLGFVIDRADLQLGSVSGTRIGLRTQPVRITVSVRPLAGNRSLVRANAQYDTQPIEDPKQYQDFFASLEKSLFLEARAVE